MRPGDFELGVAAHRSQNFGFVASCWFRCHSLYSRLHSGIASKLSKLINHTNLIPSISPSFSSGTLYLTHP